MPVPEVSLGFNRQVKHWMNEGVVQGFLTDEVIAPLTTVAGLRAVTFTGPEVDRRFYEMFQKAVDRGQAIGVLTDAAVAGANDVAGLLALFTANDPTLQATESFSLAGQ
jgi:hypothetical protein